MARTAQSMETKALVQKATEASRKARERLITAHQEEFGNILREERLARGLDPMPKTSGRMTPQQKLAKQLERTNKLLIEMGRQPISMETFLSS